MPINIELLRRLCETPGIASQEDAMRTLVKAELATLVDDISVDAMGSVVGLKRGAGQRRVMIAAHTDEIGFIVKYIDDDGFLRIHNVGGFDPRTLVAQRVWVHSARGGALLGALMPETKPIHVLGADEIKPPKLDDFFVDLGMTAAGVKALVDIGDMVTLEGEVREVGDCVMSKAMDDRVGVFVMIEALRQLRSHEVDILAVATSQEEVGLRGAMTAAYGLKPDIGIALDVTLAIDTPGQGKQHAVSRLRSGVAIKLMDSSLICHPRLVRHFRDIAEQAGIPHQLEIMPRGGTDGGAIQRSRAGVPSITISVPTRYVHSVDELVAVADVEATISLLARYLEEAHLRDYSL